MTTSAEPEGLGDAAFPPCEVCSTEPAPPETLAGFGVSFDLAVTAVPIRRALADCARCLKITGEKIDRVHAEALLRAFGGFCAPLPASLEDPARSARPDLAAGTHLVYEVDAILWHPADGLRDRIASLESLSAPEVVIAPLRERPVRFLDELGHTDLRDNQDELLDDVYYTLRHHGLPEAKSVCRVWLEAALAHAEARKPG